MTIAAEMEVAIATNDLDSIDSIHARLNGHCYVDARDTDRLPFRALVTGSTDDIDYLKSVGDVGSYLICRRTIKAGPWEAIGLFPMGHHPDLSHRQSDDHWRDRHAPLALIQHGVMTHYHQLSVVHTLSGTEYDGFALCGFASVEDLRERFFTEPGGSQIIAEDVGQFADTKRSPRRLVIDRSTSERFAAGQG